MYRRRKSISPIKSGPEPALKVSPDLKLFNLNSEDNINLAVCEFVKILPKFRRKLTYHLGIIEKS
jgi:hypothetical protein